MSLDEAPCQLCTPEDVILRNEFAYARHDSNALSPGHVLIIPLRHVADYFQMTAQEKSAVHALLDEAQAYVQERHRPDGYNIGVNVGKAAGQSRMHVHVHLIPRYQGDVAEPAGGIRCVLTRR